MTPRMSAPWSASRSAASIGPNATAAVSSPTNTWYGAGPQHQRPLRAGRTAPPGPACTDAGPAGPRPVAVVQHAPAVSQRRRRSSRPSRCGAARPASSPASLDVAHADPHLLARHPVQARRRSIVMRQHPGGDRADRPATSPGLEELADEAPPHPATGRGHRSALPRLIRRLQAIYREYRQTRYNAYRELRQPVAQVRGTSVTGGCRTAAAGRRLLLVITMTRALLLRGRGEAR